MPAPPLNPALAEACVLLERGAARRAAEKLAPLIRDGDRDADILLTYAAACEQLGFIDQAVSAVQLALHEWPDRPDLWARFGELLTDGGRPSDAVPVLERAVALAPGISAYWYNLGVAAISAGLFARAIETFERSLELDAANAAAWAGLGVAQQQSGAVDQSAESLFRALELDPSSLSAAHNLAVSLRMMDRSPEGLAVLEEATKGGLAAPESKLLRAHLLGDVGRFDDAVGAYRAIVETEPTMIEAHEILARLLPQLGRADETLDAYETALRQAPTPELYRSALDAAWALKKAAELERWSDEGLRRFGDAPDLKLMRGLAQGLAADIEKALATIEEVISDGYSPALSHGAYFRLKLGDLKEAERLALAATGADFTDQSAWSHLTVIWRLLEDPRERWLADYDRLVMPIDLQPPEGFGEIGAFMSGLTKELTALHETAEHPPDQSLRQGTQTRGNLFDKRSPLIRQLAARVEGAIAGELAKLPSDPTHPFLSRNTGQSRFLGSWSVRLRSGGFHVSHIHQLGWLSSALYVDLPPEFGETTDEGALTFGVPDRLLGLDLPPRRVEVPRTGRLVLFPSYFWHGTLPFESEDYRLTVAFDAAPA